MKRIPISAREYIPVGVFILVCILVGLFTFQDYGESRDERAITKYGTHSTWNYSLALQGQSPVEYGSGSLDHYGPAFFIGVSLFSRLSTGVIPTLSVVDSWHLAYFITFEISVFFMYLLARRFFGPWASFGTAALYGTQPLLWGHAFINPKDTPFMVFFLIAVVLGLKMVDQAKGVFTYNGEQAAKPESFMEIWTRLDRKTQTKFAIGWLLVFFWLFLIVVFRSVFQNITTNWIASLYNANPGGLLAGIFSSIAAQSAQIPVESYIHKGQILLQRFLWYGWVVLFCGTVWFTVRKTRFIHNILRTRHGRIVRSFIKCPVCVLAGVFLGMTVSIRVLGPYVLILVGLYAVYSLRKKAPVVLVPYLVLAGLITYLAWPFLWKDPLRFFSSLKMMSSFPWYGDVLFSGQLVRSNNLPWYYLPKLMALQFTEPAVLMFLPGLFLSLHKFIQKRSPVLFVLILLWMVVPLTAIIIMSDTLYDNFRHILFLVPPVFLAGGIVLDWLFQKVKPAGWRAVVLLIVMVPAMRGLVILHPYQYTYFNGFAGGMAGAFRQYEMDYWLTSFKEMAHYLNDYAEPEAKVLVFGPAYLLASELRDDIHVVKEVPDLIPDFAVVPARKNDDLLGCKTAPVVYKVEKAGAVLGVVKAPQAFGQCP